MISEALSVTITDVLSVPDGSWRCDLALLRHVESATHKYEGCPFWPSRITAIATSSISSTNPSEPTFTRQEWHYYCVCTGFKPSIAGRSSGPTDRRLGP